MAIVKLKKLTLCGLKSEKTAVLTRLQALGGAHLISLNQLVFSPALETQKHTEKSVQALKYLNQCAKKRHQLSDKTNFDLHAVVQQVLDLKEQLRDLSDQRDFLLNRIEEIKPWGNFLLSKENDLAGIKLWFYIVPKRLIKKIQSDLIFQVVHEDNISCYVVVLSKQEPLSSSIPVSRTHTGKIPLSQLNKDLQAVALAIEDKQAERESLTRWIGLITLSLADYEDNSALKVANSLTYDESALFAIQAWIPAQQFSKFGSFASDNGLALLVEDVSKQDRPPTLLKNPELVAGGEEIVKFYQMPAYNDWDPSAVIFFSFAFFFAMILSDAGYASAFFLLLALKWHRLGRSIHGKRLRTLAFITLVFSVLWGVLSGGYFGYNPAPESFLSRLKILDIKDFDSMMRLSIIVGGLHIVLANLIKAYQLKGKKTALASLGWVCLVSAGFLLWLAAEGQQSVPYSLFVLGCCLLLFFSRDIAIKKPSDLFFQILSGIKNMAAMSKLFGDILSYLRLFALGLASASLAITFNQLAAQVYSSGSGSGLDLLWSILILIFGHTLNLMLCLMSGVVHGLRLNFIEFYNWSVSDEGYPFKTFSKKGNR